MDRKSALQEFGKYIRESREAVGLTQLALGVEIGFKSGQFISNIERGKTPLPHTHIPKMANALKIELNAFIDRVLLVEGLRIRERFPNDQV